VLWQGPDGIKAARVSPAGRLVDTGGVAVPGNQLSSVAFDGANFLAIVGTGWQELSGVVLTPQLQVVDTISIADGYMPGAQTAFDGLNYLLVGLANGGSDDSSALWFWRITPAGKVLDTAGITIAQVVQEAAASPVIASRRGDNLIVWCNVKYLAVGRFHENVELLYGASVTADGRSGTTFLITQQPVPWDDVTQAAIAGGTNQSLVVYSRWTPTIGDRGCGNWRLWGQFLASAAGNGESLFGNQPQFLWSAPSVFRRMTAVGYQIAAPGLVRLAVSDVTGRTVRTLFAAHQTPGRYRMVWNGTDNIGHPLNSGVYFLRLQTPEGDLTRKVVLTR
jgi:hypothetical protein